MSTGRSEFVENGGHAVCLHEERWGIILAKLTKIEEKLDHHHYRMFVDNGSPSIQTRLTQGIARFEEHDSRLTRLEKAPARMLGIAALVTTICSAVGGGIVWLVSHLSMRGHT